MGSYLISSLNICLETIGWLYLVQLGVQLTQAFFRIVTRNPGHPVIRLGHALLGLTGMYPIDATLCCYRLQN